MEKGCSVSCGWTGCGVSCNLGKRSLTNDLSLEKESKLVCVLGSVGQLACAKYCQELGARGGFCDNGTCTCIW